jgi:hypothetical protein
MKTLVSWLPQIVLVAGIWTAVNGILHTAFVLAGEHGKQYNRELLRLLTDGLLLTTFGILLILCFGSIRLGQSYGIWIAVTVCSASIAYCMLIWPFLKSVGTLAIHTLTLVCLLLAFFTK